MMMRPTTARLREFLEQEDGPTATEYAIMLALIIVGAIATIGGIGSKMQSIYDRINTEIPS